MAQRKAITVVVGDSQPQGISEADVIVVGGLQRESSGSASLFDDNNTTDITIGSGSGLTGASAILIDGSGGGVDIQSSVNVDVSAGASSDLTLGARGSTTALNESSDTALAAAFSTAGVSSLIGALNAIQDGRVSLNTTPVREAFVAEPGQTVFTASQDLQGPFKMYVNGISYFEVDGYFVVSGSGNRTFTWQEIGNIGSSDDGSLDGGWRVIIEGYPA